MKKFAIVLGLFILAGCASGPFGHLPSIESQSQAGDVYVIRNSNFFGSGVSYYILVDKEEVFAIRTGQYTKFRLASGEHAIAVKCPGGASPTWKEDVKIFSLEPQQEVYFIVGPTFTCADIQKLSLAEGKEWVKKNKYVPMSE